MKITNLKPFLLGSLLLLPFALFGQTVDYSVVSVPEESGLELVKITADNDQVAMPLVRRTRTGINWTTGKIVQISPEGDRLAFISARSNTSNVFVKDIDRQGSSVQRTSRTAVNDFSFSPDGQYILFSEAMGRTSQIFLTDASQGFVCRQTKPWEASVRKIWLVRPMASEKRMYWPSGEKEKSFTAVRLVRWTEEP